MVKLAAAEAAQATARAAQDVADEVRQEAEQAIAESPVAETAKVNIREMAKKATESAIHMIDKFNLDAQK